MKEGYPEILLQRMLETYSPSGKEKAISSLLADEFRNLGLSVRIDEVDNVEGRAGSGSPKALLCGHMDTVEGFIEVKRKGKVIFGRGAVDAKSPLAALICAGAQYTKEGGKGTIVVLAVVDEEGKSRGIKHFVSRCNEKFDYAIFGEPSGTYAVTVGYKGRLVMKARCLTAAGHASAPQLFENAIYVATKVIDRLRKKEAEWAQGGDAYSSPTLSVTMMRGGRQDNTVPDCCEIVVDIRVPSSTTTSAVKEELVGLIEGARESESKAKIEYEFIDENAPFREDPASKLVQAFKEAVVEKSGRECRLSRKTGTSDVNDFVSRNRTSAVVYGPGNSKLDHTTLENVSIEEYYDSIDILKSVMQKMGK